MPRKKNSPDYEHPQPSWYASSAQYIPFIPTERFLIAKRELKGDFERVGSALTKLTEKGVSLEFSHSSAAHKVVIQAFNKHVKYDRRLYIQFFGEDFLDALEWLTVAFEGGTIVLDPVLAFQASF